MRRHRPQSAGTHAQHKRYSAADFQSAMYGPEPRTAELLYLQAVVGPAEALLPQSQPLTGTIYTLNGPMDVAEALVAFGVKTALYRFGTWVVTDDGIACLTHHYPLTLARLDEQQDWASHLAEQAWVNLWDFLRALRVASHVGTRGQPSGSSGDPTHPA